MKHYVYLSAAVLFAVLTYISCKPGQKAVANTPVFNTRSTAETYDATMGQGRGVLFQIRFDQPEGIGENNCRIDSLYVHGKKMEATWQELENDRWVEANYFVPAPAPADPEQQVPTLEAPDPIAYLSKYQPAFLFLHYKGEAYQVPITFIPTKRSQ